MIEPGQQVVLSLVPSLRAEAQGLVIVPSRFLDEPLETDVTPHLEPVLVEGQEGKEPGDPSVAVAKGVDAEEIEDQGRDGHERRRRLPSARSAGLGGEFTSTSEL